ncbi:MAG: hypothetical protein HC811_01785 [Flammeovirgaceae bacterium]|nr:hypothetical protein [Flammeovirgaceae bacterium]
MRIFKFMLAVWFMVLAFHSLTNTLPFLWITVYGALSILCVLAVFEFYRKTALVIVGLMVLVLMINQLDGFVYWFNAENKWSLLISIEDPQNHLQFQARNFFRLLFGFMTILLLWIFQFTHRQPS